MSSSVKKLNAGETVVVFGLGVLHLVVEAWIVAKLWSWFVVPLGVHPLAWAQAAGLEILVVTVVPHRQGNMQTFDEWIERFGSAFGDALSALGIGALIHWVGR